MSDPSVIVALIGAAVASLAAVLSYVASRKSTAHTEVAALRAELAELTAANRRMWAYCRKLIDHIYRGLGPPPPPPDDLEDLFPKE